MFVHRKFYIILALKKKKPHYLLLFPNHLVLADHGISKIHFLSILRHLGLERYVSCLWNVLVYVLVIISQQCEYLKCY